ncbi:unnamed protein product [Cyprideis torosa]|uniref:peptidyl-tRNA hydrolase n=1 Tax=Cyprideis torosa TaxID=163714 RepID=A0A7R8ZKB8_9CRUS|nr:unnamed protein product [Cyprideis torosa]CAG0884139.1 unnamed protein product [Cyprideis torosa]
MADPLVQFVVLRKDLLTALRWPWGALVAQVMHATSAVSWKFCYDPITDHFEEHSTPEDIRVLQIDDEESLRALSAKLTESSLHHVLWNEQPEDIPTCIATRPAERNVAEKFFQGLQEFTREDGPS